MTENTEIRKIYWRPFILSLVSAPLTVTLITVWITPIPYVAMMLGGPIYLAFGAPLLIWHLRRHPPQVIPIIALSLIPIVGMLPLTLVIAAFRPNREVLEALPFLLSYSAAFAILWSATFTLFYQWLTRRL